MTADDTLANVQAEISDWQRQTFGGDCSALAVQGVFKKLEKEMYELMLALAGSGYMASPEVAGELADCLILLLGIATKLRMSAAEEIETKMKVNRARRWPALKDQTPGQPVSHLEEAAPSGEERA